MNKTIKKLIQEYKELRNSIDADEEIRLNKEIVKAKNDLQKAKNQLKKVSKEIEIEEIKDSIKAILLESGEQYRDSDVLIYPSYGGVNEKKSSWDLDGIRDDKELEFIYKSLCDLGLIKFVIVDNGASPTLVNMLDEHPELKQYYSEVRNKNTVNFKWL